jgi:hypothetical protein
MERENTQRDLGPVFDEDEFDEPMQSHSSRRLLEHVRLTKFRHAVKQDDEARALGRRQRENVLRAQAMLASQTSPEAEEPKGTPTTPTSFLDAVTKQAPRNKPAAASAARVTATADTRGARGNSGLRPSPRDE